MPRKPSSPALRHHLAGKPLGLVDLVDDRLDLAAGELAGRVADGALLFGEREIHGAKPPSRVADAVR